MSVSINPASGSGQSSVRPRILSPTTKKPALEDIFGKDTLGRLIDMLEKDGRLTPGQKTSIIFRVMRRKDEIGIGGKSLGDIAAEEANGELASKSH